MILPDRRTDTAVPLRIRRAQFTAAALLMVSGIVNYLDRGMLAVANPMIRAQELSAFLAVSAVSESPGCPALAKMYHQRIGTFASIRCRAIDYDVRGRSRALDAVLDAIVAGTEQFRARQARSIA